MLCGRGHVTSLLHGCVALCGCGTVACGHGRVAVVSSRRGVVVTPMWHRRVAVVPRRSQWLWSCLVMWCCSGVVVASLYYRIVVVVSLCSCQSWSVVAGEGEVAVTAISCLVLV